MEVTELKGEQTRPQRPASFGQRSEPLVTVLARLHSLVCLRNNLDCWR